MGPTRLTPTLCLGLLFLSLGCGSDVSTRAGGGPAPTAEHEPSVYFVHRGSGWTLEEAVNRREYLASEGLPSLDWYAEYERSPDGSETVRFSGHMATLEEVRQELRGFELEGVEIRGADGLGGTGPDGRSAVLFEVEDGYTMLVSSDALDVADLGAWADDLDRATEEEWIEAGGVKPRCCARSDR